MQDFYIINNDTIMFYRDINFKHTVIFHNNDKIYIRSCVSKVINASIKTYNSNFFTKDLIKKVLCTDDKLPIVIDITNDVIIFPTHSYRNKECVWINFSQVKYIRRAPNNHTAIYFINGKKYLINKSFYSMKNQINKCMFLRNYLLICKKKIIELNLYTKGV